MNEDPHSITNIRDYGHGINFFRKWGHMAWVNFMPKVIRLNMGLQ